ncbi:MAG: hypothetical protein R3282_05905 [Rhodothermales bacterium]|nr:hypothetical protein [Rhodothermales bacterium]
MSIDIDKARQDYQAAVDGLREITRDITAKRADVDAAQDALEKVMDDYLDRVKADVEERTRQYLDFIQELEGIIDDIGRNSQLEGVRKLKKIVDEAAGVVNVARDKDA